MNTENITKLIKFLSKSKTYNQSIFCLDCGTPCCIAGHTVAMKSEGNLVDMKYEIWSKAREILGLSFEQSQKLFRPCIPTNPTLRDALKTLRHLRDTGEVRWPERR